MRLDLARYTAARPDAEAGMVVHADALDDLDTAVAFLIRCHTGN